MVDVRIPKSAFLLAIETSGLIGSVAAAIDGKVVAEESFERGMRHGRELVPRLDTLCRRIGRAPRSVSIIAVSVGPGSYTGVRVGVTCAKTLAFAAGAALVAVPTLEVLAQNAEPSAATVGVITDARRGQVYFAAFERHGDSALVRSHEDAVLSPDEARHRVPPGAAVIGDVLPGSIPAVALARHVALLGWRDALAGRTVPPHDLTPIYLRRPEAEERLHRKNPS